MTKSYILQPSIHGHLQTVVRLFPYNIPHPSPWGRRAHPPHAYTPPARAPLNLHPFVTQDLKTPHDPCRTTHSPPISHRWGLVSCVFRTKLENPPPPPPPNHHKILVAKAGCDKPAPLGHNSLEAPRPRGGGSTVTKCYSRYRKSQKTDRASDHKSRRMRKGWSRRSVKGGKSQVRLHDKVGFLSTRYVY